MYAGGVTCIMTMCGGGGGRRGWLGGGGGGGRGWLSGPPGPIQTSCH